MKAAICIFNK